MSFAIFLSWLFLKRIDYSKCQITINNIIYSLYLVIKFFSFRNDVSSCTKQIAFIYSFRKLNKRIFGLWYNKDDVIDVRNEIKEHEIHKIFQISECDWTLIIPNSLDVAWRQLKKINEIE